MDGDAGRNMIGGAIMLFLNYFYTDIFGLAPALVGVLLLSVRAPDAVTDPHYGCYRRPHTKPLRALSSLFTLDVPSLCPIQRPNVYHA